MLLDHRAGQSLARHEIVHETGGHIRNRDGSDLDALPSGELQERAPAATNVKHAIARLHAATVHRIAKLALHPVLERLVVSLEKAVRIAPDPLVEPQDEEIRIDVVMALDPSLITFDLSSD